MSSDHLNSLNISPDFRDKITTQEYGKRPTIDGVRLIDLRQVTDDGGSFLEVARFNESGYLETLPDFQVRQSSYSLVLPGAIKAFHLHYRQDDVWFVPPTDRLLAGLVDVRADSPSSGVNLRIALGGGKSQLLFIPRGVAHGVANVGQVPSTIFYFVNQQFDASNPDERRLPSNTLGDRFWEIQPG